MDRRRTDGQADPEADTPDAVTSEERKAAPVEPTSGLEQMQYFCNTACMKSLVTVTNRGVVTLPAGLRRALGIKADDTLIAETTPEGLLLRPAVTLPVEIYSARRVREFDEAEEDLSRAMRKTSAKATKPAKRRR